MSVSRLKKPTFYTIDESRDNAFATGGVVTTAGGYRIHTFTSANSLVVTNPGNIEYLVVAGGGGGGSSLGSTYAGGGAGAGGLLTGTLAATATTYSITIGQGGIGMSGTVATIPGTNTTAFGLTAVGGGGGGYGYSPSGGSGGNGGSGGSRGEGGGSPSSGTGIAGQGFGGQTASGYGGGGGATAAGLGGGARMTAGGTGLTSSITGTSVEYAKGGGVVDTNRTGDNASLIGSGGFGGMGSGSVSGGAGSNGIVIVRYLA